MLAPLMEHVGVYENVFEQQEMVALIRGIEKIQRRPRVALSSATDGSGGGDGGADAPLMQFDDSGTVNGRPFVWWAAGATTADAGADIFRIIFEANRTTEPHHCVTKLPNLVGSTALQSKAILHTSQARKAASDGKES